MTRALVAGALTTPLLLGAPSVALASDYGDNGHEYGWSSLFGGGDSEQNQDNTTGQVNYNDTEAYQVSIGNEGDTDQSLDNDTDQHNDNGTEQLQFGLG